MAVSKNLGPYSQIPRMPTVGTFFRQVTNLTCVGGDRPSSSHLRGRSIWPGLHVRPLDPEVERLSIEMAVPKGTHLPAYVEEFRRIVRRCLAAG